MQRGTDIGADCQSCPFNGQTKVFAEIHEKAKLVVVGEGPGIHEARNGRPFIGPTGQMLSKSLGVNGVKREDLVLTNATLCLPTKNASEADKVLAAGCCKPRLDTEVAALPQQTILALGAVATGSLIQSEFKITQIAGTHHVRPDGREVIPTIHPAAILRAGSGDANHGADLGYWNLVYDVRKAWLLANGKDIRFKPDVLPCVNEPTKAEALMGAFVRAARAIGIMALDTETYPDDPDHSALELPRAVIRAVGVATPFAGFSFTWNDCTDRTAVLLKEILADESVTKVFHNALYDMPVLSYHGMPVKGPIEDTLIAHHNAFPGLAHKLQGVAAQFYAIPPWKSEFRSGDEDSLPDLLKYNALDTLSTARIVAPLQVCIKQSKADQTYEVDKKMIRVVHDMHMNGFPIDLDVNQQLRETFSKNISEARDAIEAEANSSPLFEKILDELAFERAKKRRKNDGPDITDRHQIRLMELLKQAKKGRFRWGISSNDAVIAYLKCKGVKFHKTTQRGKIAIDKEVLEALSGVPEARSIVAYRESAKLLATFVDAWPFYTINGRIHPTWSINAITGRWRASNPACMNVSSGNEKKGIPNLRSQVVAPSGRNLIAFDFSAIEARLIAILSGDDFMLDIFNSGKDLHDEVSREIWPGFDGLPYAQRKIARNVTKTFEYAKWYGAAPEKIWQTLKKQNPNYKFSDVLQAMRVLDKISPRIEAWHEELVRQVALPPYEIRSAVYGRRRVFPLGNAPPSDTYNFGVQSTAADLMAKGILTFLPKLPPTAKIILQIHDCLIVEADEDDTEIVKQAMLESFTQEMTHNGKSITFTIEVKDGKSWADV